MRRQSVGSFDAKTHFSSLLERVAKGEVIEITRRGKPVAELRPVARRSGRDAAQALEELRKLRKGIRLNGLSIRDLIEEGRRY